MSKINLKYVAIYKVRGKDFSYYRRDGKRFRIHGDVGSDEWRAEYERIHTQYAAGNVEKAPPAKGSFAALWVDYAGSKKFAKLVKGTQDNYRRSIEPLVKDFGHMPIATLESKHIQRWTDELEDTPRTANALLTTLRLLLNYGMKRGMVKDNQALLVDPTRYKKKPYRPWSDKEIDIMTGPEAGDGALPVLLGLYTAQRRGDVLAMKWTAYDGETIAVKQSKTGTELAIPVHPILRAALDMEPRRSEYICTRPDGKPWRASHFSHSFAKARERLGLSDSLHFHGLRHTAASRLAEAGCSHAEIQAITGHKTIAMVAHYASGAKQKTLSAQAIARLPSQAQKP